MAKIKVQADEQLDKEFKLDPNQWAHRLTITLKNGETIVERVNYPIGDFKNPFTWEIADNKFRLVTEEMLGEAGVDELLEKLHNLETIEDINDLF